MKYLTIILTALTLTACSMSGFKPPNNSKSYWTLPGNNLELMEYTKKRSKEMRECGIDPFVGSTTSIKESLCMEEKGWRDTAGWTCEQKIFRDDPICVEWRHKRGR